MSDPSKDRIKRFLKQKIDIKIDEKPTQKLKQDFIKRKLFSTTPQSSAYEANSQTFGQKLQQYLDLRFMAFDGRSYKIFRKETFPLLAFISFSTFILYKMETEYDKMVRSVTKVKSEKKLLAEEEEEYIRAHLVQKSQLGKNQIQDVPDRKGLYQFEKYGDIDGEDEEDGDFSTKEDFYDLLRRDYNKGMQLPDQYASAVQQYAEQQGKKLRYGSGDEDEESDDNYDYIVGGSRKEDYLVQDSDEEDYQ